MGRLQTRYGYTKDQAKQEMENWLESLGQTGDSVMAQVSAAKDGAKQVADNFTTAMQKSVENNPVATLAMVAAVAFVIGAIWRA